MARANELCGIYQFKHKDSGKVYIGSSKKIKARIYEHIWELKRNEHHSPLLQRAWNKYGEDSFEISVLLICSQSMLIEYEQMIMDFYSSYNPSKGYNICNIANRPPKVIYSEQRRKEMSEQRKGKHLHKDNPERYKKILAIAESRRGENHHFYGKPMDEDRKKKMIASKKALNKPAWNKGIEFTALKGIKRSEEVKEKIRATKRSKECPYAKVTHEQVREIRRIKEELNLSNAKIGKMYGLCKESIRSIVLRLNFSYID